MKEKINFMVFTSDDTYSEYEFNSKADIENALSNSEERLSPDDKVVTAFLNGISYTESELVDMEISTVRDLVESEIINI